MKPPPGGGFVNLTPRSWETQEYWEVENEPAFLMGKAQQIVVIQVKWPMFPFF